MLRVFGRFVLAVVLPLLPLLVVRLPAGGEGLAPNVPATAGPRVTALLHVPLDFPTIQAAIDAAQAGDEVRIVMTDVETEPEYFGEHLTITKTLTLSGGWNGDFSQVIGHTYLLPNWDEGSGRGITIAGTDPISVTIRGLIVVGGKATGLGCGTVGTSALFGSLAPEPETDAVTDNVDMTASVIGTGQATTAKGAGMDLAGWMAALDGLAAKGRYPGGSQSLQDLRARVEQLAYPQPVLEGGPGRANGTAPSSSRARVDGGRAAGMTAGSALDCGGGVFAEGASLVIEDSQFLKNVAAETGDGAGGGVFVTGGSLLIENSSFNQNAAGAIGNGVGGGLYVDGVPAGGSVTLRQLTVYRNLGAALRGIGGGIYVDGLALEGVQPSVLMEESEFRENIAGRSFGALGAASYGGGMFVTDASGAQIRNNSFLANTAAGGGIEGYGGGLDLQHSPEVVVSGNMFKSNIANAQSTYQYKPGTPPRGQGGGAVIMTSRHAQVTDNLFEENIAALQVAGEGGGLAGMTNSDATYSGNRFVRNMAAFQPTLHYSVDDFDTSSGGGFQLSGGSNVTVTLNIFGENYSAFRTGFADQEYALAGGLGIYQINGALVTNNFFTANIACGDCEGYGGGVAVFGAFGGHTQPTAITLTANSLVDNAASLAGYGVGGGIYLYNLNHTIVQANRVESNQASAENWGSGGGIGLSPYFRRAAQTACQDVRLDGNVVTGNRATLDGGGILAWGPDQTVVANNVVAGNQAQHGAGVAYYGTAPEVDAPVGLLVNNTIVGNEGEAILVSRWLTSTVSVVNNIVVSQTVGVTSDDGSQVDLSYTLWHDNGVDVGEGITQTHGLSAPPGFVNAETGDYRPEVLSAAREAGDPAGVPPAPAVDIVGTARPVWMPADLGAYEWVGGAAFLPMVERDG